MATTAPTAYDVKLAFPLGAFLAVFFLAPLAVLLVLSFQADPKERPMAPPVWPVLSAMPSASACWATRCCWASRSRRCAYSWAIRVAYAYTRVGPRLKSLIILIVLMPLLTSVVVRTFAWIVILGRQGIVNSALMSMGIISTPLRLIYTDLGLVVALAQVQMPLMVLPLITAIGRIDPNLTDASLSLGSGAWRTFLRVTLPLSLPGIIAGSMLTYAAAITAFITQSLVGGGQMLFMPMYIYQQASTLQNWPFAAAISIIFLVAVLAVVMVFNLLGRLSRGYASA